MQKQVPKARRNSNIILWHPSGVRPPVPIRNREPGGHSPFTLNDHRLLSTNPPGWRKSEFVFARALGGPGGVHPDTAPERRRRPSPLPPSHALGAHGRGVIRFSTLPRAAARPARSGTGLALGWYVSAPTGRENAALRAGEVELVAVSGCARPGAWERSGAGALSQIEQI